MKNEYKTLAKDPVGNIQKALYNYGVTYGLYEAVMAVVAKFNGKKVTKAIATAVNKELADWGITTYYKAPDNCFSKYELSVWGSAVKYDSRLVITLGSYNNPVVDMITLADSNARYGNIPEYVAKLEAELPNVESKCAAYKEALAALEVADKALGACRYYALD